MLKKCDNQYLVSNKSIFDFRIGEKVFLKSNPEFAIVVSGFDKPNKTVICKYFNSKGDLKFVDFPPQCILSYKYAGLIIIKDKWYISLN